ARRASRARLFPRPTLSPPQPRPLARAPRPALRDGRPPAPRVRRRSPLRLRRRRLQGRRRRLARTYSKNPDRLGRAPQPLPRPRATGTLAGGRRPRVRRLAAPARLARDPLATRARREPRPQGRRRLRALCARRTHAGPTPRPPDLP